MEAVIAKQLGTVQQTSGKLIAKKSDSSEKVLLAGDPIHQGDVLVAEGGSVLLNLSNGRIAEIVAGQTLDLGSQLTLAGLGFNGEKSALAHAGLLEEIDTLPAPTAGVETVEDIEELPPTESGVIPGPAPAAGNAQNTGIAPGASTAFGSDEVIVQFGFDTNALSFLQTPTADNIILPFSQVDSSPESELEAGVINLEDQVRSEGSSGQTSSINFTITSPDGVSSVVFSALSLTQLNGAGYTSGGEDIVFTLSADGQSLTGSTAAATIITFSLNSSADLTSGIISATIFGQFDHGNGSDALVLSELALQVTDGDLLNTPDVVTAPFSVQVADALPSLGEADQISLSENANPSNGSPTNQFVPSIASGSLGVNWGADNTNEDGSLNDRSVVFDPALDGQIAPLTSDGKGVVYSLEQGGTVLVARTLDGNNQQTVFTINLSDLNNGDYTVEMLRAIDHSDPSDPNADTDVETLAFGFTATDADGDTANGSFSISIEDDTPLIGENSVVRLDDENLSGGIAGGTDDDATAPRNVTGTLNHNYGADGAGSVSWIQPANDNNFSYSVTGNILNVSQNGVLVVTATITNATTGAYAVEQHAAIDHGAVQNENDLQLNLTYIATDGDGDQSAEGTLTVNLDDDMPTVSQNDTVRLDDENLSGGIAGGTD
ncbi:DUF5801 repeats-in-toxin domain-containing protein, partial [Parendozoicomonas sp. Alg238-R29]|uniref:DUF5801 repeats-in-toxin domain-containing protein n=1 Tax=Parendozoicomonas sp. Alg238-R29 TaxID=2993446 RepID=UPI00248D7D8B